LSATLDPKAFRDTLGLFATGVAVIATTVGDQLHAMTANAVSSLSLDPMLVLFCCAKRARFSQVLQRAEGFSINFLRDEQEALSTYFAGGWKEAVAPQFRFVTSNAPPRLEGCLASLMCTKRDVHPGGDHWLVVLEVRQLHRGIDPLRPLLFFRGKYRGLDDRQGTAGPDLVDSADEPAQIYHHE
jgi:flavin reductase (DIM6/NTAB) family NADH-FMN oxidoreductase RutF